MTNTQKDRNTDKHTEEQTCKIQQWPSTHGIDRGGLLDFSSPGDYKTHEES